MKSIIKNEFRKLAAANYHILTHLNKLFLTFLIANRNERNVIGIEKEINNHYAPQQQRNNNRYRARSRVILFFLLHIKSPRALPFHLII